MNINPTTFASKESQTSIWKPEGNLRNLQEVAGQELSLYAKQYKSATRQYEFIASRLLANEVLAPFKKDWNHLRKNNAGKPYLHNWDGHISISHSDGYVAFAWGITKPLAIDIQAHKESLISVGKKVFSEAELAQDNPKNLEFLAKLWTAKEAVFKASVLQNPDIKNSLNVNLSNSYCQLNANGIQENYALEFHKVGCNLTLCIATLL